MKNVLKKCLLIPAIAGLVACSGSGNCPPNENNENGNIETLQVITPKNIYSKNSETATGYVIVKNPTDYPVKNLHYSLGNLIGSGSTATIDAASAAACSVVAAYSQCNVKLNIPAGAVAGSLAFNFNNIDNITTKSSQYSINSLLQIGIEQARYNNISGLDGITINYYHTIIAGIPYVLVNGLVASNNVGTFNNIVLVNNTGAIIPNQQLISGSVSSTQGSTFSILLPAPTGSGATQTFKVQTQVVGTDGSVISEETSTASNTLTTSTGIGIADMLPGAVYLTASNPQQIITFANTGDNIAQLQKLVASESNIEVTFTPQQLSSGAIATATLKLLNTTATAQSGSMILNYNNGKGETAVAGDVNQNITPQPNPTPSPTPSPTPTPPIPPAPTAGLTIAISPDNDFFTTTVVGSVSRQLTITNNGSTIENNFVLTLPEHFAISAGSSNSCTVTHGSSPATISDSLIATTGSCTLTVIYTNINETPLSIGNINIAYDYNNGTAAPTPATTTVNYRVTPSSANLTLTPNAAQTYSSITSNNSDVSTLITYTLTNIGEVPATSLAFNFAGTDSSLFHEVAGSTCTAGGSLSNISSSNTCTINTQFGPAPNGSAGSKTATFNVGYTPYSGGGTRTTADVALNGTVTAAPSASYSVAYSSAAFTTGTGTEATPYQGLISTNYTITVTYTNTSAVAATGFTTSSFTASDGFSKTATAPGSGCNGVTMTAGGTCSDTYTLNSTAPGNHSLNLASVTTSWTDSSGTYPAQSVAGAPTVYANLIAQTVAVNVTSITASGFVLNTTADGKSQTKPLALHYNTITESTATLSLTYQNSGTIDATSFTSSIATLPTGWSRTTHGCNNTTLTLNNGNSCIDIYSFTSKPSVGTVALTKPDGLAYATNFNINDVKLSWNSVAGNMSNQTPASITTDSNASGIVYSNYFLQIFVSNATHNGNFATDSTNIGTGFVSGKAITNADALCANDSNKPNDGYAYKALLSYGDGTTTTQGSNRFACGGTPTSPSCGAGATPAFDWVLLKGFVQYRSLNSANTSVVANTLADYGVTTVNARPGNFMVDAVVWTGLSTTANYQWTSSTNSCDGWQSDDGSGIYKGGIGKAGESTTYSNYGQMYAKSTDDCNTTHALYCVQQVP